MDYVGILKKAERIVDEAGVAEDLRGGAFRFVADRLGSLEGQALGPPRSPDSDASLGLTLAPSKDSSQLLSAEFDVPSDDVRALFDLTGDPELNVHSSLLPESKSEAVRDFAVVVALARQAVGLETTDKDVRRALDRHGQYDPTNFTKQVAKIPPQHIGYSKVSKTFMLRNPGRERARELVKTYLGVEA